MFAQLWEYTKNHWILYFKWVNFMACNLYLNKAVILKKKRKKQNWGKDHIAQYMLGKAM